MATLKRVVEVTFMNDPQLYVADFKFIGSDGFTVIERGHYRELDDVIIDIKKLFRFK